MNNSRPLIAVVQLVHQPIGGVQSVLRQLLPRLNERFRIIVVDPYVNPDFAELCRTLGLETAALGSPPRTPFVGGKGRWTRPARVLRRAPWMIAALIRFHRWVRTQRVDVVWFHQLQTVRYFGRVLPAAHPAVLYHAHGFTDPAEIGSRTARWLSRRATVVAVSKDTARIVHESGVPADSVRVVYNAVDAARVRALALQDGPPLPPRSFSDVVFLHAATLNRHKKAQHLAIAALARIPDSRSHLWICGDVGPEGDRRYAGELRNLAERLNVSNRVHFLGWRKDLPRVIAQADVTMLTSICPSESFGMVLVEAMALGKPCIATSIGGPPEVIVHGETGYIAQPNPPAIAEAMARLIEAPDLRARFGECGRARAESFFSLNRQAAELSAILDELTTSVRERPA